MAQDYPADPGGGMYTARSNLVCTGPAFSTTPNIFGKNEENSNKCSEQVYQSVSADKRKDIFKDP